MPDSDHKRMLEMAAKAAGRPEHSAWLLYPEGSAPAGRQWNPLTDDGDALRLAVQCGLEVSFVDEDAEVRACVGYPNGERISYCFEDHRGDIFAATRRCITRAAAAIGEQMP